MERACRISDENGSKKIVVIMDRENAGWANFDRRLFSQISFPTILQDYYAERLHAIYILHTNWVFKSIMAIVKPFLAENTKKKMNIISNLEELKNYFDEEILLQEHGGIVEYVNKYKCDDEE